MGDLVEAGESVTVLDNLHRISFPDTGLGALCCWQPGVSPGRRNLARQNDRHSPFRRIAVVPDSRRRSDITAATP
jgi:hypothetical protein